MENIENPGLEEMKCYDGKGTDSTNFGFNILGVSQPLK